jgi:hypothetical protein
VRASSKRSTNRTSGATSDRTRPTRSQPRQVCRRTDGLLVAALALFGSAAIRDRPYMRLEFLDGHGRIGQNVWRGKQSVGAAQEKYSDAPPALLDHYRTQAGSN